MGKINIPEQVEKLIGNYSLVDADCRIVNVPAFKDNIFNKIEIDLCEKMVKLIGETGYYSISIDTQVKIPFDDIKGSVIVFGDDDVFVDVEINV